MITELNKIQVNSIADLQKIAQDPSGASVEITYWRFNADTDKEERHQAEINTTSLGAPSQSRAGIGAGGVMVFIDMRFPGGPRAMLPPSTICCC